MADAAGSTGRLRALAVALAVGILGLVVAFVLGAAVVLPLSLAGIEVGATTLVVISLVTGQGIAFGGVALLARNADAELATMLLIRGSYLFLAVLLAALLVRPFG